MGRRVVVIGAGIVGLATARAIKAMDPSLEVEVVEKEGSVAGHQTGRNSGVIHAGVYYKPGSLKAELCTRGRDDLMRFCKERGVPFQVCGKLVVATEREELERMATLEERCAANGVPVTRLDAAGVREVEPHCAGLAALHVHGTGVVDYADVSRAMRDDLNDREVSVRTGVQVRAGGTRGNRVTLDTDGGSLEADFVVNCAGLYCDHVARLLGGEDATGGLRIVPFRGEYHELSPNRDHLVRALIYPVPDPRFPFLGVHLTRGIGGGIHVGPNAVLAFRREGYRWTALSLAELSETIRFPGFRALARQHWRYGMQEMTRSLSLRLMTKAVQRLVPEVTEDDLHPAPAGVRAQAVGPQGNLIDDFAFGRSPRALHVLNAPSPAATASLAIGAHIAERVREELAAL